MPRERAVVVIWTAVEAMGPDMTPLMVLMAGWQAQEISARTVAALAAGWALALRGKGSVHMVRSHKTDNSSVAQQRCSQGHHMDLEVKSTARRRSIARGVLCRQSWQRRYIRRGAGAVQEAKGVLVMVVKE